MIRLRITYSKKEEMRFTSHLDLYRAWERTFRRAKLPLAYSQGFKPHPKINIAAALPLGFTSSNDIVDVWLREEIIISEIKSNLERSLPPGLEINEVVTVDLNLPALQSQLCASLYFVTFSSPQPGLQSHLLGYLTKPELITEKKGKTVNIRPLIFKLDVFEHNPRPHHLEMVLSSRQEANLRPDEVLQAMHINTESALFHRQKLIFENDFLLA